MEKLNKPFREKMSFEYEQTKDSLKDFLLPIVFHGKKDLDEELYEKLKSIANSVTNSHYSEEELTTLKQKLEPYRRKGFNFIRDNAKELSDTVSEFVKE